MTETILTLILGVVGGYHLFNWLDYKREAKRSREAEEPAVMLKPGYDFSTALLNASTHRWATVSPPGSYVINRCAGCGLFSNSIGADMAGHCPKELN